MWHSKDITEWHNADIFEWHNADIFEWHNADIFEWHIEDFAKGSMNSSNPILVSGTFCSSLI